MNVPYEASGITPERRPLQPTVFFKTARSFFSVGVLAES